MSWVLGIDEAGRGPVLGPLVLCGVRIERSRLTRLEALGVRDSKSFGSGERAKAQRKALAMEISKLASVHVEVAEPDEVDRFTREGGLNRLEQDLAARVIEASSPCEQIWADGARLFSPLQARFPQLEAENRADRDHAIVAAASIVAKVERDERLAQLLAPAVAVLGEARGGGYPNAATARFLQQYVTRFGALPPGVRRSWSWPFLQQLVAEVATRRDDGDGGTG